MEQECFLCQLDTQAKQLGSPSGYDEQAASDCASITSGCAATKYTYEISRAKLPTLPLQVCPGQYATLAGITPSKMATCATRLPRRRAYRLRPSSTSLTLMRATTGFLLLVRISAFYCLAHSTKSTSNSSTHCGKWYFVKEKRYLRVHLGRVHPRSLHRSLCLRLPLQHSTLACPIRSTIVTHT